MLLRVGFMRVCHRDEGACIVSVSDVLCISKKTGVKKLFTPYTNQLLSSRAPMTHGGVVSSSPPCIDLLFKFKLQGQCHRPNNRFEKL
jgi:hypothetical protein